MTGESLHGGPARVFLEVVKVSLDCIEEPKTMESLDKQETCQGELQAGYGPAPKREECYSQQSWKEKES